MATGTSVNGTLSDMTAMDVGTVGTDPLQPGYSVSLGNDGYFVAGGGHDIWDNADGFQSRLKPNGATPPTGPRATCAS